MILFEGLNLILGEELQMVKEKISCPQLGDDHYGSWGGLSLRQRFTIARLISTIEYLDNKLEEVMKERNKK